MAKPNKKRLGKGLDALFDDNANALDPPGPGESRPPEPLPDGSTLIFVNPEAIEPNPYQPRHHFAEEALQELAESIRRDGVQEPIIVRRVDDKLQLVGGERRVRASVMADVAQIPAICRDVPDKDMLKLSIIENVQREDLNAIELAQAYQTLIEEYQWTQERLAEEVGKNRATVTNILRLLNLPAEVQHLVADGRLSMGHARALLAIESAEAQNAAARKIISQGLSVRQAEKLVTQNKSKEQKAPPPKDPNIVKLEDDLRHALGTKVAVKNQSGGRGKIEIEYYNLDDLERILAVLKQQ
ncbi:MAG: ParB/RepB/Spo0J family partition protein [Candidatus Hydrogenedentota bacterium]